MILQRVNGQNKLLFFSTKDKKILVKICLEVHDELHQNRL
jgi:hypothetical protein